MVGRKILLNTGRQGAPFRKYKFAGQSVVTDAAADRLKELTWPSQPAGLKTNVVPNHNEMARHIARHGIPGPCFSAWLGQRRRTLRTQFLADNTLLHIEGMGEFVVTAGSASSVRVGDASPCSEDEMLEVSIGPLLALLLAERNIFVLHASAIADSRGAICFLGESGAGKSTIGAYLGTEWERHGGNTIADDVLPTVMRGRFFVLPDHPQLKLPAQKQQSTASAVPVRAIINVLRQGQISDDVRLERKSRKACILALAQHTVASRLFHETLLRRHFDFCTDAGAQIPYYELSYPHEPGSLATVLELMDQEFQ